MASRHRRGFCPRLMLTSRQRLRAKERTIFVLQRNTKWSNQYHPSQSKTKRTPIWCPLVLAGMDGFEPSKCQSQSLVPYRLATSQYCVSIVSHFALLVKHFIKKIIFYEKYDFEYDDNELSDIKLTIYEDWALNNDNRMNPLRYMLPELPFKSIKSAAKKSPLRSNIVVKIDIDWEGKNISEMEYNVGDYSEKFVFEYDNKKNPFRGFLGLYFDELILAHGNFASKNNVTKIIITEDYKGATATDTEIISYTYDGIFPATRSYDGSTEYFEYE